MTERRELYMALLGSLVKQRALCSLAETERRRAIVHCEIELKHGPDIVLNRLLGRFSVVVNRKPMDAALRIVCSEFIRDMQAALDAGKTYAEEVEARLSSRRHTSLDKGDV